MPFPLKVKESPARDRPRERLLANGAAQLPTSDLLAILIRSGRAGESAVQAGQRLAAAFANRLDAISDAGRGELKEISSAVGPAAYCQIMAGVELGRRVASSGREKTVSKIASTQDAIAFCQLQFARLASDRKQEEFHIVTMNIKNQVTGTHQITVGTLDASLVHPREVFRPAIKDAAASILLVHNHPSGDPTPSDQDIAVTARLDKAGATLGIDVLDHIIVTWQSAVSIRQHAM